MKQLTFFLIYCLFIQVSVGQTSSLEITETYSLPKTSIRAIETNSDGQLWFAGSNGIIGSIKDSTMEMDTINIEGKTPQFRSIAATDKAIYILSIEDPALLYTFPKQNFTAAFKELSYREEHEKVFYNSLKLNGSLGVAMGDPTDGYLSVLISNDQKSWQKLDGSILPTIFEGEAGFAASNTNVSIQGDRIWIATGGMKARVFYSYDAGKSWKVSNTPLQQGAKMTGIFSMDFHDENLGIIAGGNWEEKSSKINTLALTLDGGKNWKPLANGSVLGYISCVQFVPGKKGQHVIATSTEGTYYSVDTGKNWEKIADEGYYTLRMIDQSEAWMATYEKIVKVKINLN